MGAWGEHATAKWIHVLVVSLRTASVKTTHDAVLMLVPHIKLLRREEMKARWLSISAAAVLALAAAQANAEEGLDLTKKSGCLACHSVEKKVVGPARQDETNKNKDDTGAKARLVEKVKKGGKGNWTEVTGGVPMPPYSPRVADADIEKLVDFV